jgi:pimeloyl-ACP methyl ester carboxylesterase
MPTITGDEIAVATAGAGEPTLLFVHGLACSGDDWSGQVAALSPKYRCVTLDLPGHGRSRKAEENSIVAMGDAVIRVKNGIGASRIVLIGHSMGARVIRQVYRMSPENVAGMVFVDSAWFVGDLDDVARQMATALARVGYAQYTANSFGQMIGRDSDPALRERIVRRALTLDETVGQDLLVGMVEWDRLYGHNDLAAIKAPALVIQSSFYNEHFQRVPITRGFKTPFMQAAEKWIERVRMRVVEGVGHFPMLEAADQVNRHIEEFVSTI